MAIATESRRHWFLVSFYYSGKDKKNGFGSLSHRLDQKNIKDRDFDDMVEHAKNNYGVENIVILSVSYLGHMTTEEKTGKRG